LTKNWFVTKPCCIHEVLFSSWQALVYERRLGSIPVFRVKRFRPQGKKNPKDEGVQSYIFGSWVSLGVAPDSSELLL